MPKRKKLPGGVEIRTPINRDEYLPFRFHKIWAACASPHAIHSKNGITVKVREWRIMLTLATICQGTNSEIAQNSLMDMATTTRAIQELLRIGFVTARPHNLDGRKQVVTLTQKGANAHDEIAAQRLAYVNKLTQVLSKQERRSLLVAMNKLDARAAYLNQGESNSIGDNE